MKDKQKNAAIIALIVIIALVGLILPKRLISADETKLLDVLQTCKVSERTPISINNTPDPREISDPSYLQLLRELYYFENVTDVVPADADGTADIFGEEAITRIALERLESLSKAGVLPIISASKFALGTSRLVIHVNALIKDEYVLPLWEVTLTAQDAGFCGGTAYCIMTFNARTATMYTMRFALDSSSGSFNPSLYQFASESTLTVTENMCKSYNIWSEAKAVVSMPEATSCSIEVNGITASYARNKDYSVVFSLSVKPDYFYLIMDRQAEGGTQ